VRDRGAIRVLFAFDPRRTAILVLGGVKAGRWPESYVEAVPEADRLYEVTEWSTLRTRRTPQTPRPQLRGGLHVQAVRRGSGDRPASSWPSRRC